MRTYHVAASVQDVERAWDRIAYFWHVNFYLPVAYECYRGDDADWSSELLEQPKMSADTAPLDITVRYGKDSAR